jgi:hypothetical protein
MVASKPKMLPSTFSILNPPGSSLVNEGRNKLATPESSGSANRKPKSFLGLYSHDTPVLDRAVDATLNLELSNMINTKSAKQPSAWNGLRQRRTSCAEI